jgi:hypothetical protein
MKHILSITFILFYLTTCVSQIKTPDYSTKVKEEAEIMGQLLLKKDYDSFIKFNYPKLIEMMGGKEKMVEKLSKEFKKMNEDGFDFISMTFGNPSEIISINKELQCTLPQNIEMKVPGGRIVSQSTLIAISTNGGKNWCFIDPSGKDIQAIKRLFSNLSEKLVIPQQDKPIFYKN